MAITPAPWLLPCLLVSIAACSSTPVESQESVQEGLDHLFVQDRVVDIAFETPSGFQAIVDAYLASGKSQFFDCGFTFDEEEALESVGLRLRAPNYNGPGRLEEKYALKVNFNYFDGPRFHTLDKLYLSNNKSDPSLMREHLAGAIYEAMGVPTSRTAYAWVKVDGQDMGLYTMVEEVEKRFFRARYGNADNADDGNLYKCEVPGCDLTFKGSSKENYLDLTCLEDDGCGLVLKSNEEDPSKNNYGDIVELLDLLNNTPDDQFQEAFGALFDVDSFLRYLAVAVTIGDYDGYIGAIDNFYLYFREDVRKWIFIPVDHRKAFGIKGCALGEHETGVGILSPECTADSRPLVERILAVESWRVQYIAYVKETVEIGLDPEWIAAQVASWDALIRPLISADPNALVTPEEYEAAISAEVSVSKDMNLLEFINARRDFLKQQLEELGA